MYGCSDFDGIVSYPMLSYPIVSITAAPNIYIYTYIYIYIYSLASPRKFPPLLLNWSDRSPSCSDPIRSDLTPLSLRFAPFFFLSAGRPGLTFSGRGIADCGRWDGGLGWMFE